MAHRLRSLFHFSPSLWTTPNGSNSLEKRHNNNLQLASRLGEVVRDRELYKQLLECQGNDAQTILDTIQVFVNLRHQLLDDPVLDAELRPSLIVAAQRLAKKSKLYPDCYELKKVILDNPHPITAGGFADIFKGKFEGQPVALKAIRIYQNTEIEHFLKVLSSS
ncbi:hypothetical protein C0995_014523 [Termitomyces sp. Mi166|nr:hypothetical protein C0995_014523 [Termitomyces sp. Mi166\